MIGKRFSAIRLKQFYTALWGLDDKSKADAVRKAWRDGREIATGGEPEGQSWLLKTSHELIRQAIERVLREVMTHAQSKTHFAITAKFSICLQLK